MTTSAMLMCAAALGMGRSALGLGVRSAPPPQRRSRLSADELMAGGKDADEEDDFDTWYFEQTGLVYDDVDEDTAPSNPSWHKPSPEEASAVSSAKEQCALSSGGKPSLENGVITYLVTRPFDLIRLKESAPRLRYYFLRHWQYPVKIFIPGEELRKYDWLSYMDSPTHQEVKAVMRDFGGKGYHWEIVPFDLKFPKVISRDDAWTIRQNSCAKAVSTSYKHMNQFFTKVMYEHPALAQYRYYLRLDADFSFVKTVKEDPFCMMRFTGRKFVWQKRKGIHDPRCSDGLWEWFESYRDQNDLAAGKDEIFWGENGAHVNYVGFATMGDLNFFRSERVRKLAHAINEDGRIYLNRWSDQTYYVLLLALFEEHTKVGDMGFNWPKDSWCHKCEFPDTDRPPFSSVPLNSPLAPPLGVFGGPGVHDWGKYN